MAKKKTTPVKIDQSKSKKKCISCDKEFPIGKFYLSNNDLHKNNEGRFPSCKVCVLQTIDYENMQTIYDLLAQMNRPYLHSVWQSSIAETNKNGKDLFGIYYKNCILNYKTLTWKDSIFENSSTSGGERISTKGTILRPITNVTKKNEIQFEITSEMVVRWGSNHEIEDYIKLEDFYNKMKLSNRIETPQDETYLKKLSVISLKMDQELDAGNYGQVKQLGDLFSKYMADSKFRAMDKTEADKTGGIRNFGAIYAEVEKDGHIPPWEEFRKIKGLTQDLVDQTIMHIENFTLRLNKIERMVEPPTDTPKITDDTD